MQDFFTLIFILFGKFQFQLQKEEKEMLFVIIYLLDINTLIINILLTWMATFWRSPVSSTRLEARFGHDDMPVLLGCHVFMAGNDFNWSQVEDIRESP